jgi:hypothetical protein
MKKGGGAHDALHGERCACGNDPVVDVAADKVAAVDAAYCCGAGVAVPAASARHGRARRAEAACSGGEAACSGGEAACSGGDG